MAIPRLRPKLSVTMVRRLGIGSEDFTVAGKTSNFSIFFIDAII